MPKQLHEEPLLLDASENEPLLPQNSEETFTEENLAEFAEGLVSESTSRTHFQNFSQWKNHRNAR